MKSIIFCGSALDDLKSFPKSAQREAGYQLDRVQNGLEPNRWKPINTIGAGVNEIRIYDETGAYRVIYLAKFAQAVYVLHCFQKKTARTNKQDIDKAESRYRNILKGIYDEI